MSKLYLTSLYFQMVSLARLPAYWIPNLLFPVMLYSMLASGGQGIEANIRAASFVIYGVIGIAFFQFGVSISIERETQWERYRRTLPGSAGPRMISQVVSAIIFALASAAFVIIAAFVLSEPELSLVTIIQLLFVALLVTIPFTFLGIALGYFTSSKSSVAIANLLYLPLAFLGGLWIPPQFMPEAVAGLSFYTPTRHAAEIAWATVAGRDIPVQSIYVLMVFTVIFGLLAWIGYQRDEKTRYA